jgi:hypothetical protein
MTRDEHLMTIAMEECNEVAQRISKAKRFGMDQIQEDADDHPEENPERLTNRRRIVLEYYDLRAVLGMIGIDAWDNSDTARAYERQKVQKVERYLWRSAACGTFTQDDPTPDLLAALKAVVAILQKEAPGTPLNHHQYDVIGAQARAAIAKAEGRG